MEWGPLRNACSRDGPPLQFGRRLGQDNCGVRYSERRSAACPAPSRRPSPPGTACSRSSTTWPVVMPSAVSSPATWKRSTSGCTPCERSCSKSSRSSAASRCRGGPAGRRSSRRSSTRTTGGTRCSGGRRRPSRAPRWGSLGRQAPPAHVAPPGQGVVLVVVGGSDVVAGIVTVVVGAVLALAVVVFRCVVVLPFFLCLCFLCLSVQRLWLRASWNVRANWYRPHHRRYGGVPGVANCSTGCPCSAPVMKVCQISAGSVPPVTPAIPCTPRIGFSSVG